MPDKVRLPLKKQIARILKCTWWLPKNEGSIKKTSRETKPSTATERASHQAQRESSLTSARLRHTSSPESYSTPGVRLNQHEWIRSSSERVQGSAKGGIGTKERDRRSSSTRKSLSRLRDSYVGIMLKVADFNSSSGAAIAGSGPLSDSQLFESNVFRKRSQVDSEMIDYCLQSSIQPNDWKEAQLGGKLHQSYSKSNSKLVRV